jgi:sporulation-control protein spo0M
MYCAPKKDVAEFVIAAIGLA